MLTKRLFISGFMVLYLLIGFARTVGQDTGKPILLGKSETGTVTEDAPETTYLFAARANLNVQIEVLIADGDLVPQITLKQSDVTLGTWDGEVGEASLTADYSFKESGQYTIVLGSIDQTGGIFVMTVREAEAEALTPLSFDVPVSGSVARGESLRYAIQADATSSTNIAIDISNLTQSVSATLTTPDGKTIGVIGQDLGGGGFRIPSGDEQYILEVKNGDNGSVPVNFNIVLSRATP